MITSPLTIDLVPIDTLIEHPRNIRMGDVGAIVTSIEAHGVYRPLVVQRSTGHVLAGNHTLKALRATGAQEAQVTYLDVDDDEALQIMLIDNRASDLAHNDDVALVDLLKDLAANDLLDGTGYDGDDIDQLLADIEYLPDIPAERALDPEPSAAAVALKKWKVKDGSLWRAGDQTVFCGDSTDAASYRFEGTADIVWTDPPYGVAYDGGKNPKQKLREGITGDAMSTDDLLGVLTASLTHAFDRVVPGGAWYVAAPPGPLHKVFADVLADHGWHQTLTWLKQRASFGRSDYHYKHETIFYGWKPGAAHTWSGDRKQVSVLEHDRPSSSPEHPTMKPVSLITHCIANHRTPNALVLDPFSGSGSTLLAAHHLGLCGYGIEIDPKFVAVTLDRLQAVGLTPERVE